MEEGEESESGADVLIGEFAAPPAAPAELSHEVFSEEAHGALSIQRVWRAHRARCAFWAGPGKHICAKRVQKRWRGYAARMAFTRKVEKHLNDSAALIAALFRGFRGRRAARIVRAVYIDSSARRVQRAWRGRQARRLFLAWKFQVYTYHATKVQGRWRAYKGRVLARRLIALRAMYRFEKICFAKEHPDMAWALSSIARDPLQDELSDMPPAPLLNRGYTALTSFAANKSKLALDYMLLAVRASVREQKRKIPSPPSELSRDKLRAISDPSCVVANTMLKPPAELPPVVVDAMLVRALFGAATCLLAGWTSSPLGSQLFEDLFEEAIDVLKVAWTLHDRLVADMKMERKLAEKAKPPREEFNIGATVTAARKAVVARAARAAESKGESVTSATTSSAASVCDSDDEIDERTVQQRAEPQLDEAELEQRLHELPAEASRLTWLEPSATTPETYFDEDERRYFAANLALFPNSGHGMVTMASYLVAVYGRIGSGMGLEKARGHWTGFKRQYEEALVKQKEEERLAELSGDRSALGRRASHYDVIDVLRKTRETKNAPRFSLVPTFGNQAAGKDSDSEDDEEEGDGSRPPTAPPTVHAPGSGRQPAAPDPETVRRMSYFRSGSFLSPEALESATEADAARVVNAGEGKHGGRTSGGDDWASVAPGVFGSTGFTVARPLTPAVRWGVELTAPEISPATQRAAKRVQTLLRHSITTSTRDHVRNALLLATVFDGIFLSPQKEVYSSFKRIELGRPTVSTGGGALRRSAAGDRTVIRPAVLNMTLQVCQAGECVMINAMDPRIRFDSRRAASRWGLVPDPILPDRFTMGVPITTDARMNEETVFAGTNQIDSFSYLNREAQDVRQRAATAHSHQPSTAPAMAPLQSLSRLVNHILTHPHPRCATPGSTLPRARASTNRMRSQSSSSRGSAGGRRRVNSSSQDGTGSDGTGGDDDAEKEEDDEPVETTIAVRSAVLFPDEVELLMRQARERAEKSGLPEHVLRSKTSHELLAEYVCGRIRATTCVDSVTGIKKLKLVFPFIKCSRDERNRVRMDEWAALLAQRAFRGFQGRALWRRAQHKLRENARQVARLAARREALDHARQTRGNFLSAIQAVARGVTLRTRIRRQRAAVIRVQTAFRCFRARLIRKRMEYRKLMGPEVLLVYNRGAIFDGVPLLLRMYRCGSSYKFVGQDTLSGRTYQGCCYSEDVARVLREHNERLLKEAGDYEVTTAAFNRKLVRPWQHDRITQVLRENLSLVSTIPPGSTEFAARDNHMTLVVKYAAGGPGIQKRSGLRRVLRDQSQHVDYLDKFAASISRRSDRIRERYMVETKEAIERKATMQYHERMERAWEADSSSGGSPSSNRSRRGAASRRQVPHYGPSGYIEEDEDEAEERKNHRSGGAGGGGVDEDAESDDDSLYPGMMHVPKGSGMKGYLTLAAATSPVKRAGALLVMGGP